MDHSKKPGDSRTEEIIRGFEREQSESRELNRRHSESVKDAHRHDRQLLIERRRQPR